MPPEQSDQLNPPLCPRDNTLFYPELTPEDIKALKGGGYVARYCNMGYEVRVSAERIDGNWTIIYKCTNPYCSLNGPAEGDGFAQYPGGMNQVFENIEEYINDAFGDPSNPADPLV